jgi:hypothetical protein
MIGPHFNAQFTVSMCKAVFIGVVTPIELDAFSIETAVRIKPPSSAARVMPIHGLIHGEHSVVPNINSQLSSLSLIMYCILSYDVFIAQSATSA